MSPPRFTFDNYQAVLSSEGIAQCFINSITVAIPSTVIPIMIAAFAAYALAWMRFPGRGLIVAIVVGLLVVPLQMSLIPLLRLYNGIAKVLRHGEQGLSRCLAGAHSIRSTARDLSAAQLHGRPAARDHGVGAHRRRYRTSRSSPTMVLPLSLPGPRLVCDLPVPVDLERPSGGSRVPRCAERQARAHRATR